MQHWLSILILLATLGLTGCIWLPMTYPETDADELDSPFDKINVLVDMGSIEMSIKDKDKDMTNLKFISAEFISPQGENIRVTLGNGGYPKSSGTSLHQAFFRLDFGLKNYYPRGQFQLKVITELGGNTLIISGKFSEHKHTRMVNMEDALDPGGR